MFICRYILYTQDNNYTAMEKMIKLYRGYDSLFSYLPHPLPKNLLRQKMVFGGRAIHTPFFVVLLQAPVLGPLMRFILSVWMRCGYTHQTTYTRLLFVISST